MKIFYTILFNCIVLLFIIAGTLFFFPAKALPDFDFSVEVKNESCSSDGKLIFSISPSLPAAVVEFTIYLLPELTKPLKVQSETVLSNLTAGDYRIVAKRELNGEISSKLVNVTIKSVYEPLDFEIIPGYVCGSNDGELTINMLSGDASTYEIQGPVNLGPQAGNVFSNLPKGSYNVQVTNNCGERLSQTFEILETNIGIDKSRVDFRPLLPSCGEIIVGHYLTSVGSTIQYPISLEFTVYPPSGGQEIISTTIDKGPGTQGYVYGSIPFFNSSYRYDVKGTDKCGNTFLSTDNVVDKKLTVSDNIRWGAGPCGKRQLAISPMYYTPPFSINFSTFPTGFDPSASSGYPGPFNDAPVFFGGVDNPIPDGQYIFEVTDGCGNSSGNITINHKTIVSRPSADVMAGCDVGVGSVQLLNYDYNLTSVKIIDAPPIYNASLPHDVSLNIRDNDKRKFSMNKLPEGKYEFATENSCGTGHSFVVEIQGHKIIKSEVEIVETCGSFNLTLDHESSLKGEQPEKFGLQKFNPKTGNWEHPVTGENYIEGEELTKSNAVILFNRATNYNFPFSGFFRVVKSIEIWKNGSEVTGSDSPLTFCLFPLKEFEVDTTIGFNGINVFSCSDESFDVAVAAKGYEPISYKITSKNGKPFELNNENDPLFKGLEKGLYAFQISDKCGNILNKVFRVTVGIIPKIIPNNLCDGESGELSVIGLDFLSFEWWKDDEPGNILSTSSNLPFTPFDVQSDPGLYKVRLTHSDPNSCLNEVLEFEIPADDNGPQAGTGVSTDLCEGEIVDLFDLLEGPFDTYGYWEETTESNSLIGNFWTTTGLPAGVYEFIYQVPGLCDDSDQSQLTINLSSLPGSPSGEAAQYFCESDKVTVSDLAAEGNTIRWFLQSEGGSPLDFAEALTTNTSYYAEQYENNCPSSTRLETIVSIEYEVDNNLITDSQVLNRFEIPDVLSGTTPTGGIGIYEYQWQQSYDQSTWENISGAKQQNYQPEILMEPIYYRRMVEGRCMEYISNVVLLDVKTVDLTISKTSYNKEINDGAEFLYEIEIKNNGSHDATNVKITDILPPEIDYVKSDFYPSSSDIQVTTSTAQKTIFWEIPLFPKGESLNLQLTVVALEEGEIENQASVESKEEDDDLSNNEANDRNKILPLFIPNVIKPDFDGKNDYFVIREWDKFKTINLVIFNRWGDHVYESREYKNDWSAEDLNSGTYYYLIRTVDYFEKERSYKGYIQVIK